VSGYAPQLELVLIMATVKILASREQAAHFGLYRTSVGGSQSIFVRRKCGEPTDYMHTKSRKLQQQRANMSVASKDYARLSPSQKAETRHQFEEVEYQKSHGKTDTKLLTGRQLFISKDIHSLATSGKKMSVPYDACIVLSDPELNLIPGGMRLHFKRNGEDEELYPEALSASNFLFHSIPTNVTDCYLFAASPNYYDFGGWEPTFIELPDLLRLHYYCLPQGYLTYSHYYWLISWIQGWLPDFNLEIHSAHIHVEITGRYYEGELKAGIRDFSPGGLGGGFLFEQSLVLHPDHPDPQILDFWVHGLTLSPGHHFYMRSFRLVPVSYDYLFVRFYIELTP